MDCVAAVNRLSQSEPFHMDQITVYLFIAIAFGLGFLVRITREISNQLKKLFEAGFGQTAKGTSQAADIRG